MPTSGTHLPNAISIVRDHNPRFNREPNEIASKYDDETLRLNGRRRLKCCLLIKLPFLSFVQFTDEESDLIQMDLIKKKKENNE